jgi:hypothetical protein
VLLDEGIAEFLEGWEADSTLHPAFPPHAAPIIDEGCCDGDGAHVLEVGDEITGVDVETLSIVLSGGQRYVMLR